MCTQRSALAGSLWHHRPGIKLLVIANTWLLCHDNNNKIYVIIKAIKLHGLICKVLIHVHLTFSASWEHEVCTVWLQHLPPMLPLKIKLCDPSNLLQSLSVDYFLRRSLFTVILSHCGVTHFRWERNRPWRPGWPFVSGSEETLRPMKKHPGHQGSGRRALWVCELLNLSEVRIAVCYLKRHCLSVSIKRNTVK